MEAFLNHVTASYNRVSITLATIWCLHESYFSLEREVIQSTVSGLFGTSNLCRDGVRTGDTVDSVETAQRVSSRY